MTMLPPCAELSPILAAGLPPMSTLGDPTIIVSGGPTHTALAVRVAAGIPPTRTKGTPGGRIGPPTWGMGGTPGVCIGHTCMSPTLAPGLLI